MRILDICKKRVHESECVEFTVLSIIRRHKCCMLPVLIYIAVLYTFPGRLSLSIRLRWRSLAFGFHPCGFCHFFFLLLHHCSFLGYLRIQLFHVLDCGHQSQHIFVQKILSALRARRYEFGCWFKGDPLLWSQRVVLCKLQTTLPALLCGSAKHAANDLYAP